MSGGPIIRTEQLERHFGKVEALEGHRPRGRHRVRPRAAGAQRRRQDHQHPDPHHAPAAERRACRGGRARRREGRRGAPIPDRPGGPERGRRREPHRLREPRDGGAPVRAAEGRGAQAQRRDARAVRPVRRDRPPGEDLLRRHAPAPGRCREPRRPPRHAVPRRADDGARPAQPRRRLGVRPRAAGRRHDDPADHAVPRGGRPARRPDHGGRPRQDHRRGHVRPAQGPDRRRGARAHRRGHRTDGAAAEALQGIGTGDPNVDVDEGRIRVPVGNEGAAALRDSSRPARRAEDRAGRASPCTDRRSTTCSWLSRVTPPRTGSNPRSNRRSEAVAAGRRRHERDDRPITHHAPGAVDRRRQASRVPSTTACSWRAGTS